MLGMKNHTKRYTLLARICLCTWDETVGVFRVKDPKSTIIFNKNVQKSYNYKVVYKSFIVFF